MSVTLRRSVLLIAGLALLPSVASAEEKKPDGKDPNRIICEKQEVLGSRLQAKRVCLTAAEWARKRLEDRQTIDRAQSAAERPVGS